jgi:hypothetical protein
MSFAQAPNGPISRGIQVRCAMQVPQTAPPLLSALAEMHDASFLHRPKSSSTGLPAGKLKRAVLSKRLSKHLFQLVEPRRIELLTSAVRLQRSPS